MASVALAAAFGPTAAQANIGDSAHIVQAFTVSTKQSASGSGRCAVVTIAGNLDYTITDKVSTDLMGYDNFKVMPSSLVLRTRTGCGTAGTRYILSSGASVRLSFWSTVCQYNAAPSAGFPLGISIALTPQCGNVRTATYFYSHSATASNFSLSLKPAYVRYPRTSRPLQPNGPAPCVRAAASEGVVYVGSRGYPFGGASWLICANH